MEAFSPLKSVAVSSLFDGIEALIDKAFGDPRWRRQKHFGTLSKSPPAAFDARALVLHVHAFLSHRWDELLPRLKNLPPSSQNWRWFDPKIGIDTENNDSPEQTLERALVRACLDCGRSDWSNQVPLASGIVSPYANKTTAIDLIHRRDTGRFDLVELKVGSNTPISAAFQVIQYGMIWAFSRRDRRRLRYIELPILEAASIQLSVLAPLQYYGDGNFDWLAEPLSACMSDIARRDAGAEMCFTFEAFPPSFNWPAQYSAEELCRLLDSRQRR